MESKKSYNHVLSTSNVDGEAYLCGSELFIGPAGNSDAGNLVPFVSRQFCKGHLRGLTASIAHVLRLHRFEGPRLACHPVDDISNSQNTRSV